jgi:hypothetical protein
MSTTIDVAFTKEYESEVHLAYQRQGSKLRNTVRRGATTGGEDATFQKIGKGTAGTKTRHGLVPVMNLDHTNVVCPRVDRYAGEWVDKLDELKINIDERRAIASSQAWALGRATDEDIITALDAATNSTTITVTSEKTIRNSVLTAVGELLSRNVPFDGRIFGAISPRIWQQFMTFDAFSNSDYAGPDLPYKAPPGSMRTWLDVHWINHTGLPLSSTTRTGFLWHQTAIGHGIQQDVTMDITWHGDRAAHFFSAMMSMGAVLIDDDGVEELSLDESSALPTS